MTVSAATAADVLARSSCEKYPAPLTCGRRLGRFLFGSFLNGLGAFLDTGAIECGLVFRTAFWHDIAEIRAGFAAQFPVVISRP